MTIGSARPLEDAARIAYRELMRWMSADYGFDEIDAYMLLSQAGRMRLGNMVDPKYTMGASILKNYLKVVNCTSIQRRDSEMKIGTVCYRTAFLAPCSGWRHPAPPGRPTSD